jgi:hypothetical protein
MLCTENGQAKVAGSCVNFNIRIVFIKRLFDSSSDCLKKSSCQHTKYTHKESHAKSKFAFKIIHKWQPIWSALPIPTVCWAQLIIRKAETNLFNHDPSRPNTAVAQRGHSGGILATACIAITWIRRFTQ